MRLAFVQDSGMNESAALLVLPASLRLAGHNPRLFIERDEADLPAALRRFAPDVIVLPIDVGAHHWGRAMAARLDRAFAAPLVIGERRREGRGVAEIQSNGQPNVRGFALALAA